MSPEIELFATENPFGVLVSIFGADQTPRSVIFTELHAAAPAHSVGDPGVTRDRDAFTSVPGCSRACEALEVAVLVGQFSRHPSTAGSLFGMGVEFHGSSHA